LLVFNFMPDIVNQNEVYRDESQIFLLFR